MDEPSTATGEPGRSGRTASRFTDAYPTPNAAATRWESPADRPKTAATVKISRRHEPPRVSTPADVTTLPAGAEQDMHAADYRRPPNPHFLLPWPSARSACGL